MVNQAAGEVFSFLRKGKGKNWKSERRKREGKGKNEIMIHIIRPKMIGIIKLGIMDALI